MKFEGAVKVLLKSKELNGESLYKYLANLDLLFAKENPPSFFWENIISHIKSDHSKALLQDYIKQSFFFVDNKIVLLFYPAKIREMVLVLEKYFPEDKKSELEDLIVALLALSIWSGDVIAYDMLCARDFRYLLQDFDNKTDKKFVLPIDKMYFSAHQDETQLNKSEIVQMVCDYVQQIREYTAGRLLRRDFYYNIFGMKEKTLEEVTPELIEKLYVAKKNCFKGLIVPSVISQYLDEAYEFIEHDLKLYILNKREFIKEYRTFLAKKDEIKELKIDQESFDESIDHIKQELLELRNNIQVWIGELRTVIEKYPNEDRKYLIETAEKEIILINEQIEFLNKKLHQRNVFLYFEKRVYDVFNEYLKTHSVGQVRIDAIQSIKDKIKDLKSDSRFDDKDRLDQILKFVEAEQEKAHKHHTSGMSGGVNHAVGRGSSFAKRCDELLIEFGYKLGARARIDEGGFKP